MSLYNGTQKYYALDGQHRLSAIRTLLDSSGDEWKNAPKDFANEEISVIIVMPPQGDSSNDFFKRYRRLFGNLNRYAKPTSHFTNIVMDEDDTFAILTRRLITEHDFFKAKEVPYKDSPRIKMKKGKNVVGRSTVFTSLETLYAMNEHLLKSPTRLNAGWTDRTFKAFRPDDDELDDLFGELRRLWDALLAVLPGLRMDPVVMRCHSKESDKDCLHKTENIECDDSALFWPVTQEILAKMARKLVDEDNVDVDGTSSFEKRLEPLARIKWSLWMPPWRNLILIQDGSGSWKMRNEERAKAVEVAERILLWQLGIASLDRDGLRDLRDAWQQYLLPDLAPHRKDDMWEEIESARALG